MSQLFCSKGREESFLLHDAHAISQTQDREEKAISGDNVQIYSFRLSTDTENPNLLILFRNDKKVFIVKCCEQAANFITLPCNTPHPLPKRKD